MTVEEDVTASPLWRTRQSHLTLLKKETRFLEDVSKAFGITQFNNSKRNE